MTTFHHHEPQLKLWQTAYNAYTLGHNNWAQKKNVLEGLLVFDHFEKQPTSFCFQILEFPLWDFTKLYIYISFKVKLRFLNGIHT